MITVGRRSTRFGEVRVLQSRKDGSRIYSQGAFFQSHADRLGVSLAPYVHALHSLITQLGARNVMMIGCAGGTLGTMLANSGKKVSVVDINPDAFALAREFFALPAAVECHVADGLEYLLRSRKRYEPSSWTRLPATGPQIICARFSFLTARANA